MVEKFKIEDPYSLFSLKHAQELVPIPQNFDDSFELLDMKQYCAQVESKINDQTNLSLKAVVHHNQDYLSKMSLYQRCLLLDLLSKTEASIFCLDPAATTLKLDPSVDFFESVYLIGFDFSRLTNLHIAQLTNYALALAKAHAWSDLHIACLGFNAHGQSSLLFLTRDFRQFLVSSFLYRRQLRFDHLSLSKLPLRNLTRILTQEIAIFKNKSQLLSYDKLIKDGLKAVGNIKANLIKLKFKEREPLNIICNTLQVP